MQTVVPPKKKYIDGSIRTGLKKGVPRPLLAIDRLTNIAKSYLLHIEE
jgi:hypothetical protein